MPSPIPLSEIPTLTLLYKLHKLTPCPMPHPSHTSTFNAKVSLLQTDITKLSLDAIVNAANESLLGGGGVDGSIHRAAGRSLLHECETLDGCDTGDAKITAGYELPAKHVIHTVGPIYRSSKHDECEALLRSCYTTSLDVAVANGCRSVAFPGISTGIYGFPLEEAVRTAVESVKGWLEADEERAGKMERIVFCQFLGREQAAYEHFVPMYFSPEAEDREEGEKDGESGEVQNAEEAKAEDGKEDHEASEVAAKLPEVPKTNPGEADQPEPKKAKLDE